MVWASADDDAAGERAPEAAEAADDHGLEGVEEPGRTDAGIEVGAGAEKEAGDCADRERDAHGDRIDRWWSMPMSCAISLSSEVARKARPSAVR